MYIEGLDQEIMYDRAASMDTRVYYKVIDDEGVERAASGNITLQAWIPSGSTKIVSSVNMTQLATGSATYYYEADTSASTDDWAMRENYFCQLDYSVNGQTARREIFFDVVQRPFNVPLLSTDFVDVLHPDWKRSHPAGTTGTWTICIERSHAEVMRRVRASGSRVYNLAKARSELYPYLVAFTEAECAKFMMMRSEDRDKWIRHAENLWSARGEFTFDRDEDPQIDDNPSSLAQPRKSR